MDCYAAQFEPLPRDTRGVPLEHLVTCVSGLELVESGSKKYLCPSAASPPDNGEFTYYNTLTTLQGCQLSGVMCEFYSRELCVNFIKGKGFRNQISEGACNQCAAVFVLTPSSQASKRGQ